MGISIYKLFQLTFNDYKRDYNGYLTEFLNEYEDNTELYFIKEQKAILDDNLKKFKEVVMDIAEKDENQNEILDLFRNRINTTDRIKAFLEQRKQELEKELRTVQQLIEGPKILKNEKPKTNKIPEKWHALHYWFELMAHGKLPPIDLDGAFKKNELVKVGMQKCNSKGQSFYSEFKEIDINNPVLLKKAFGVDWKDEILKLAENDDVTLKYINKKYK